MKKVRLDKLLVDRGLAQSRDRAQALIMTGSVLVDDVPVDKAGTNVKEEAHVRIRGNDNPYVSRGGLKLAGALDQLKIDVLDATVLDVGASTGGFTDVCLQRGARIVYAVDVGTNQLVYSLRQDSRVVCFEKTNARYLAPEMLPGLADIAVIDVSFISLTKILEPVRSCLTPEGAVIAMVKPQFEVGRENVGKGGVVRDDTIRAAAVDSVVEFSRHIGLHYQGRADSPIKGPKGNLETFVYLTRRADP